MAKFLVVVHLGIYMCVQNPHKRLYLLKCESVCSHNKSKFVP